jgi:hypothetical protein
MHTVGSSQEAKRAVDAGVDVIVAQGLDAGGHVWGSVGTLALIPAVVDAAAPETDAVWSTGVFDEGFTDAPVRTLDNATLDRWRKAGHPRRAADRERAR